MQLNINENREQLEILKQIAYAISDNIDKEFKSLNSDLTNKDNELTKYKSKIDNIKRIIGNPNE